MHNPRPHRQQESVPDASSLSLLYSIVYNGAYLIPDTVICLILAALVGRRLLKIMKTGR